MNLVFRNRVRLLTGSKRVESFQLWFVCQAILKDLNARYVTDKGGVPLVLQTKRASQLHMPSLHRSVGINQTQLKTNSKLQVSQYPHRLRPKTQDQFLVKSLQKRDRQRGAHAPEVHGRCLAPGYRRVWNDDEYIVWSEKREMLAHSKSRGE